MSIAEVRAARFIEASDTPEALIVDNVAALLGGRAFVRLCDAEQFTHLDLAEPHFYGGNLISSELRKERVYEDGSRVKATIARRSGRMPDDHPDKRMGIDDAPAEVLLHVWDEPHGPLRITEVKFQHDEMTGTVRKRITDHVPVMKHALKAAEQARAEAQAGEEVGMVQAALLDFLAHMEEGRQLERELGYDDSILVGPGEVEALRLFLGGMTAIVEAA